MQTRAPYGYGTGHPGPLSVQDPAKPGCEESKELLFLLRRKGVCSSFDFGQGAHAVKDTTTAVRPTRARLTHEVRRYAMDEDRFLIMRDADFGNPLRFSPDVTPGIMERSHL